MGLYEVGTRLKKKFGGRHFEGMITSIRSVQLLQKDGRKASGFNINTFDFKFTKRNDVLYDVTYSDGDNEELNDDEIEALVTFPIYNKEFMAIVEKDVEEAQRVDQNGGSTAGTINASQEKKAPVGKYKAGTRIKKLFGRSAFEGIVTSLSVVEKDNSHEVWYKINYSDGDSEELDEKEVEELLTFPIYSDEDCNPEVTESEGDQDNNNSNDEENNEPEKKRRKIDESLPSSKYGIGTKVRKTFGGTPFDGEVISIRSASQYDQDVLWYKIRYSDGDSEELDDNEIVKYALKEEKEENISTSTPIGTKVRKTFGGTPFDGEVVSIRSASLYGQDVLWYKIRYSDGDSEELDDNEIKKFALSEDKEETKTTSTPAAATETEIETNVAPTVNSNTVAAPMDINFPPVIASTKETNSTVPKVNGETSSVSRAAPQAAADLAEFTIPPPTSTTAPKVNGEINPIPTGGPFDLIIPPPTASSSTENSNNHVNTIPPVVNSEIDPTSSIGTIISDF